MRKIICALVFILIGLNSIDATPPTRLYYHFLQRNLTELDHPFSKSNLQDIKDIRYYKAKLTLDDSSYEEYQFDKQGRVIEIKWFSEDIPLFIYSISYLKETNLPVTIISHESLGLESYITDFTYNEDNRLIGLKESVYEEIGRRKSHFIYLDLRLYKMKPDETILVDIDSRTDKIKAYYHLDSTDLVTKILRVNGRKDSISINKIDENQTSIKYWYRNKKNYHLGGEELYKNDVIQSSTTYYIVSNDSITSSPLKGKTYFYYDNNGLLIRKDKGYEKEIFNYNSLPSIQIVIVGHSVTQIKRYKYFREPIVKIKIKLSSEQYICQLLWRNQIDKAMDSIQKLDTLSWDFLDICATIIHKKYRTRKHLKQGKILIKQSLAIQEHPKNLSTYAMYHYLFRKKKDALKTINRAIELSKEMEFDPLEYEGYKRYFLKYKAPKLERR